MHVHPASDHLSGEPVRVRAATAPFAARLLLRGALIALLGLLTAGLWPLFLVGVVVMGWPPHQPRPAEVRRYLHSTWTARPPEPGIPPLSRAWLTLCILKRLFLVPAHGLAWYLDEVIFHRALRDTPVRAPLLNMSAARSGSTQLARYLEADPALAAPSTVQILFPYLWLWRLAPLFSNLITAAHVRALFKARFPEEFHQRHEGDPFLTDTFEVLFYFHHLHILSPLLGPTVMLDDFPFAGSAKHNQQFWTEDFVAFLDRVGRKTLIFAGPGPDGHPKRLFIKGHFLEARDALAQRYPSAHFLTVIRDPIARLQSAINHLHGNAFEEPLGAAPWAWLVPTTEAAVRTYCQVEKQWFTQESGPARTVIRFSSYVRDLEGTMTLVYRSCMGAEVLPDHVPIQHIPRERKKYMVSRTLQQLGVDAEAFATQLQDYLDWCR